MVTYHNFVIVFLSLAAIGVCVLLALVFLSIRKSAR